MIGKITHRSFVRGLLKKDIKAENRPLINKTLRAYGCPCTLYNQLCIIMGWTQELRPGYDPKGKGRR